MKYSKEWIKEKLNQKLPCPMIGFFGEKKESGPNRVYSNFYQSDFKDHVQISESLHTDVTFNCNEQYFMYRKALFFKDYKTLSEILVSGKKPYDYKQLGRKVQNYNESAWNAIRYDVMKDGLYLKFSQNPSLKRQLLQTKNVVMVEASPFDNIWGIKLGMRDRQGKQSKEWINVDNWRGQNLLGFALMETRDKLQEEL